MDELLGDGGGPRPDRSVEARVTRKSWVHRSSTPEGAMRLATRLSSYASALALLGGCATIDSTIPVAHARPIAATHLSAARDVSVETVRTPATAGTDRQGVKKNGFGHASASI